MIIVCRFSEEKSVDRQVLPKCRAYVRTIQYFCARFSRETRFSIENVNKKNTIKTITMKRKLLLLFVCLFGALGGVKAWTSVVPYDGRTYYLYNMWGNSYWYGTNADYNHTASIGDATPVTVESGHKLAFTYNNTTYRIYHSKGTKEPGNTNGVNFTFEGSATGEYGYQLMSKNDDKYERYMNDVGQFQRENYSNRDWQFISVYEVIANTPNICATEAEASYLSAANGWERVTDNATLNASLSDYFFAIVCANYPGLMVNMADGNASQQAGDKFSSSKSMWYSNSANPEVDNSFLWMIEANTTPNYEGYTFRNASYPSLTIQAEWNTGGWGMSWYAHTNDQANPCQWNSYALIPSNGVYAIKTLANGGENYLGLWTPSNDYINGQELAGNKGTAEQGKFLIYRKLKKDVNMTSLITNPSFETGALTPWSAESRNDTGVKDQSNGTYSITQGDPVDGQKLFNSWGGTGENSVSQTISLSKGTYRLSALLAGFTGETLTLSAGGQSSNVVVAGDKTYGYTVSVKFTLTETSNVTIKASNTKSQQTSDASFIKADNFRLTYLGVMATDADYTALQNAINNAEDKTLGFDDGEYAPYNNVAVLKALADAKAIDKNVDNLQMDVQDATAAIADENWTVNSGEKNAIYWPVYTSESSKDAEGRIYAIGWGKAGGSDAYNTRVIIGTTESNVGVYYNLSNHETLMTKFNTNYGVEVGYTMPLKANTLYKLSFKYGGMENTPEVTVSFTDPSSDVITLAPNFVPTEANAHTSAVDKFDVYEGYFVTNEAGNYVLNLSKNPTSQQQIAIGNIELTKVASQTLTFADNAAMPTYAPGTYPNVSIGRSIAADTWSTLVLPVNMPVPGGWTVKKMDSYDTENGLTFAAVEDDGIEAGKPYMVTVGAPASNIVASNVAVTDLTLSPIVNNGLSMKGVYEAGTVPVSVEGYTRYVVSGNQMRKVTSKVNIKPFRAYFELIGSSSPARLVISFDGEDPTGINAVEATETEASTLKDGKYLIEGKIVLVKNGVKYDANGKKLN